MITDFGTRGHFSVTSSCREITTVKSVTIASTDITTSKTCLVIYKPVKYVIVLISV